MSPLMEAADHIRKDAKLLDRLPGADIARVEAQVPLAEHITRELAEQLEALTDEVSA